MGGREASKGKHGGKGREEKGTDKRLKCFTMKGKEFARTGRAEMVSWEREKQPKKKSGVNP